MTAARPVKAEASVDVVVLARPLSSLVVTKSCRPPSWNESRPSLIWSYA
jgi:hypothetical protein